MTSSYNIFQDWKKDNSQKGKVILVLFRIGTIATINPLLKILFLPYILFYKICVEWFLGIELPYNTRVGRGLILFHGQALVVNKNTVIGSHCTLRHCVTIGNVKENGPCPKIGNNVEIGANSCILGGIEIGDNVKIGAGSVVVKSIPANCVVVGNPAKVIKVLTN